MLFLVTPAESIKQFAREAGFDDCRIAAADCAANDCRFGNSKTPGGLLMFTYQ